MGRSDSRPEPKEGYVFPSLVWTRATCCPVRSAGSPRFPGAPLSTCRLQTPRATQHNAPVIQLCRRLASPSTWRVTAAMRVTRPNRVHKSYGLYSIWPYGLFRPCLTIRVTPTRRIGDFAVNRQLPRMASQPPGLPELRLAHNC